MSVVLYCLWTSSIMWIKWMHNILEAGFISVYRWTKGTCSVGTIRCDNLCHKLNIKCIRVYLKVSRQSQ